MNRTSLPIASFCCAVLFAVATLPDAKANDATLDPSFGIEGRASATLPDEEGLTTWEPFASTLDSAGRVLVGGAYFTPQGYSNAIARWTVDGALDATFGTGGLVRMTAPYAPANTVVKGLAADTEGGVYVLFQFSDPQNGHDRSRLCHLDASGALAIAFGGNGNGCVSTQVNPNAGAETSGSLARQADGKLLVLGDTEGAQPGKRTIWVRRFHANGLPDLCFLDPDCSVGVFLDDGNGVVKQINGPLQIEPFPGGGVAYAYSTVSLLDTPGFVVNYLHSEGGFDYFENTGGTFGGMDVNSSGRLLLAARNQNDATFLARAYDCAFVCDPVFNQDLSTMYFNDVAESSEPKAVAWDSAGRMLFGGISRFEGGKYASALRLLPDGTPDTSFGDGGRRLVGLSDLNGPDEGTDRVVGIHERDGGTFITGAISMAQTVGERLAALRMAENFVVTPAWGPNGAIVPGVAKTVGKGSTARFTLQPVQGFAVDTVTTDCVGSGFDGPLQYVTGPVTADCGLFATFKVAPNPVAEAQTIELLEDHDFLGQFSVQAQMPWTCSIVTEAMQGEVVILDAATGAFRYTPGADANGSDVFTYNAVSDGLLSNIAPVDIKIIPVNDAPVLMLSKTKILHSPLDLGPQSAPDFASAIAGPADEVIGQNILGFSVDKIDDPAQVLVPGSVSLTTKGTLFYALSGPQGVATVVVTAHDDGGTDNGGVDESIAKSFTIVRGASTPIFSDSFDD